MISYENKVLFEDNLPDRAIVIDIDCQGVLDLEGYHRRFKDQFPITTELLSKAFLIGELKPGTVIANIEDGFKILLIVTRYARLGTLKDDPEVVVRNTMTALNSIKEKKIVSPLINRDVTTFWPAAHPKIKDMDVDWSVYTK